MITIQLPTINKNSNFSDLMDQFKQANHCFSGDAYVCFNFNKDIHRKWQYITYKEFDNYVIDYICKNNINKQTTLNTTWKEYAKGMIYLYMLSYVKYEITQDCPTFTRYRDFVKVLCNKINFEHEIEDGSLTISVKGNCVRCVYRDNSNKTIYTIFEDFITPDIIKAYSGTLLPYAYINAISSTRGDIRIKNNLHSLKKIFANLYKEYMI